MKTFTLPLFPTKRDITHTVATAENANTFIPIKMSRKKYLPKLSTVLIMIGVISFR